MHPSHLFTTDHAERRYRERWRPTWKLADARKELAEQVRQAVFVERDGDALIYRIPRGALLTVTQHGEVKTVLPRNAQRTSRRPEK